MQNLVLAQLSEPEMRQMFRQELEDFFSNHIGKPKEDEPPKVVDLNGLLKHRPLVGSKSTIYKKAHKGLIPHSKRGKRLYFDIRQIDEWLLSNRVKTVQEIENEMQEHLENKKRR